MKIRIEKRTMPDPGTASLVVSGKIDETFEPDAILAALGGARHIVLDLAGISVITSMGINRFRRLIEIVSEVPGRSIVLCNVSASIAFQVAITPALFAPASIELATLPFICGACGSTLSRAVPYAPGAHATHAPTCHCGTVMELDGLPLQYLP